jgi:hypothetical protein
MNILMSLGIRFDQKARSLRSMVSVCAASLMFAGLVFPGQAQAALSINSVTVNGGISTTVAPGATITVVITNSGNTNWSGTGWYIGTTAPGTWSCDSGPSPSLSGNNQTYTFTISAPTAPGTYNAYFRTSNNGNCGGVTSNSYTLNGGVVVAAGSPLSASPTLCINDNGIGSQPWTTTSNNVPADASINSTSSTTNFLKCTGYNFNIPSNAIVTGIVVGVGRANANRGTVTDAAMRLVKAGVIQTPDRSTTTTYPTNTTTVTNEDHGGTSDLWNNSWTPADINDPNFGAAFASQYSGNRTSGHTINVGYMPITVYYTMPTLPIAEYRFDESSPGTANDSSGNNLNGTLNGGVTVGGSGKVCSSYNFNGTNAFVSVPNTALLNQSKVTVMAWVRHAAATIKSWEAILAKGDSAYRLHLNGGCSINSPNISNGLSFGINSGCSTADADSGTVPVAGTWYHVAGTYDGTTIKIYVNGVLQASGAYAGAINSNTFPLDIGENSQQTGRYWSGDIDEVKVFGTALTAAQISTGYTNENAGKNWDGTARACSSSLDHLVIQSSGSGLTCAASTLTVVACQDAACTTLYTGGVSGTLSASGTVNWDGTTGGAPRQAAWCSAFQLPRLRPPILAPAISVLLPALSPQVRRGSFFPIPPTLEILMRSRPRSRVLPLQRCICARCRLPPPIPRCARRRSSVKPPR